jgi:hypothetical protein
MPDSLDLLRLKAKAKAKAETERTAAPEAPETMGALEAALHGAGQGLFGMGDEIAGFTQSPTGAMQTLGAKLGLADDQTPEADTYKSARDFARQQATRASSERPGVFYPAMIGTGAAAAGFTGGASLPGLAAEGALAGLGSSEGETASDDLKSTALGAATAPFLSAAGSAAGRALKPLIGKGADVFEAIAGRLGNKAGQLAETATGATRVQAENFRPGTGLELLKRGLVKAGDTPESIATKTAKGNGTVNGSNTNGPRRIR